MESTLAWRAARARAHTWQGVIVQSFQLLQAEMPPQFEEALLETGLTREGVGAASSGGASHVRAWALRHPPKQLFPQYRR